MNHPKPSLKYVEADHIKDQTLELEDMSVVTQANENIGSVEGFIVDASSGRPYYLVVDAGGWFKSKHFLVPIGQLKVSTDRKSLSVPLTKQQIERFPGFDLDEFDTMTDASLKAINDATLEVCESDFAASPTMRYDDSWTRASYRQPDWWAGFAPAEGARQMFGTSERDVAADRGDASPHFDGRAQPGDVLGIETGGEETHVGETKEDEDDRRRAAEKAQK